MGQARPKLGMSLRVTAAGAATLLLLLLAWSVQSGTVRASTVTFPNGAGSALKRTQLRVGGGLRAESWRQPSGFSYSVWTPFELTDRRGNDLQCRLEVEGWVRPRAGHGDLFDARCTCAYSSRHHNRDLPCGDVKR
jgi:hypothetical protein